MAAMRGYGGILSGVHSELPEVVQSAAGSANLFPLLGVAPAFGRIFTETEDQPKGEPVVLLTWSLFQRRFAGDPSIIGKQIHLDTIPTTVVGVLPSWFTYPDARIQFWMPYAQTFSSESDYGMHDGHQSRWWRGCKPGVSAESATREVSALQYRIHLANASKPVAEDVWSRPMIDDLVKNVRTPLLVLLGAVGCMLLIACLNLTNLLVARSAARRKEVAIRGRAGRQPACSYSRADDGEPADLPGRRRTRPAAVARFDTTGSRRTGAICLAPTPCMSMDGFSLLPQAW